MHSHKLKIDLLKLNTAVAGLSSVEVTTFPHIFEYSRWQGHLSSN